MRVTAVHRYFWPDAPPYARILRTIARRWSDAGHTVEIVSAQPGYNAVTRPPPRAAVEALDGFDVRRVRTVPEQGTGPRQAANLVIFPLTVGLRLLRGPRPDVVMCSTAPQVTLGSVVSWVAARRGAAFIYHCMDLHPEIGVLSGEFAHPVVRRTLMRLDLATMRRASRVVVLSDDMRRSVTDRDPTLAEKVVIINNFSLPDDGEVVDSPLPPPAEGVLRVVFTGNLGRFQGLPDLVSALDLVSQEHPVELVFMGEGKAKAEIEAAAVRLSPDSVHRVCFVPHGPVAAAKALMDSAHVGVVSLVADVVRYAYPSKTATYADQGLPLLVICERDTELAGTVTGQGLGWWAASGDLAGIAAAMESAAGELATGEHAARRGRVREFAIDNFGEPAALQRWDDLLREIAVERGRDVAHALEEQPA